MNNHTIKLASKQYKKLVTATFPDYRGRKVAIEFTDKLTFHDVNWGGGTKNTYRFIRADGAQTSLPTPAPWVNPFEGLTVDLPLDVLVVEHSVFCGHDMGIRIYANPCHLPKWLPEATQ